MPQKFIGISIVNKHDGEIWVTREEGVGTEVQIPLPVKTGEHS